MVSGLLIFLLAVVVSMFGANDKNALIMCFDRDDIVEESSNDEEVSTEDISERTFEVPAAATTVAGRNTTKITVGGQDIKKWPLPHPSDTTVVGDKAPTSVADLEGLASAKDPNKKAKEMAQRRYDKYMGEL